MSGPIFPVVAGMIFDDGDEDTAFDFRDFEDKEEDLDFNFFAFSFSKALASFASFFNCAVDFFFSLPESVTMEELAKDGANEERTESDAIGLDAGKGEEKTGSVAKLLVRLLGIFKSAEGEFPDILCCSNRF